MLGLLRTSSTGMYRPRAAVTSLHGCAGALPRVHHFPLMAVRKWIGVVLMAWIIFPPETTAAEEKYNQLPFGTDVP